MRISFVTDLGQTYAIEIDPQMELENIMALLEAEVRVPFDAALRWLTAVCTQSGIPVHEQSISFEGRELTDPNATLATYRVPEDAMLLIRKKVTVGGRFVHSAPI